MNRRVKDIFFTLLRTAISGDPIDLCYYQEITTSEWQEVMSIAKKQGLLGILFGTLERLPKKQMPPIGIIMEWFGQKEFIKLRYERHKHVIGHLAKFYDEIGLRMMLLKGYGLSLNYPQPEFRPSGDIDIFLLTQDGFKFKVSSDKPLYKIADELITEKLGVEIDNSHHHHSVFMFENEMVENHFELISVADHPSSKRIEKVLQKEVKKDYSTINVDGSVILLPSVRANALFLVRHCASHFVSTGMTLRQLLDWLLFVRANKMPWEWLYGILKAENMDKFVDAMNMIGIQYLAMPLSLFPTPQCSSKLMERILADMLDPEFKEKENGSLLGGLWVKPRRFIHNRWKHEICYKDSFLTGFIFTLWAKLLKPSHFKQ